MTCMAATSSPWPRASASTPPRILDLSASLNPLAPDVTALAAARLDTLTRYPDAVERADATTLLAGADRGRRRPRRADQRRRRGDRPGGRGRAGRLGRDAGVLALRAPPGRASSPAPPRWRSNPNNPLGTLAAAGDRAGGVGRVVLAARHRHVDAGRRRRLPHRLAHQAVALPRPAPRLRHRPRSADAARAAGRPAAGVVGERPGARPRGAAPGPHRPAGWAAGIATAARRAWPRSSPATTSSSRRPTGSSSHDAAYLREPLGARGVLVRDCASFGLPGTIRVAVPDADGWERLAAALGRRGRLVPSTPVITLVLGGTRSGKSAVAEALPAGGRTRRSPTSPPARPTGDADMAARIAAHRARRPAGGPRSRPAPTWPRRWPPHPDGTVLVDALGTWVAAHPDLASRRRRPPRRARRPPGRHRRRVRGGRPRRAPVDRGRAGASATCSARSNTAVAAVADDVLLVVAGRVLPLPTGLTMLDALGFLTVVGRARTADPPRARLVRAGRGRSSAPSSASLWWGAANAVAGPRGRRRRGRRRPRRHRAAAPRRPGRQRRRPAAPPGAGPPPGGHGRARRRCVRRRRRGRSSLLLRVAALATDRPHGWHCGRPPGRASGARPAR